MFCPNCGSQLPDGSAFCGNCGAQLGGQQPQQAAQPQYQQPQYQQPQQPQYQQPPYQQPYYQQPGYQPAPKQKAPGALRFIALAGVVLMVVGIFLPYVSVMGYEAAMIEGSDCILFFGAAGLGLVFALINIGVGEMIAGVGGIIVQLIEWSDAPSYADKGIGYYLILAGAIVMIVGGVVTLIAGTKKKPAAW